MKWLREAGWIVALGVVIAFAIWGPQRKKPADADESRAAIEKMRAEHEERQARRHQEFERELSKIRTEGTLSRLQVIGGAYRRHLAKEKVPPREGDLPDLADIWQSQRNREPFEIVWGIDLNKLPDAGTGLLLAWERTADKDGTRCVLMADGKTTRVVSEDEFTKLPRAK